MKPSNDGSSFTSVFAIPAELRRLPQWVCWHYVDRNGKLTKPPVDAKSNGALRNAKSNDPSTWSDFPTAVAAAERLALAGVGLALSATDGLTGLDLDHVLDPETGELDPLALEVVARFAGTYAEVSPSGNGIRIWCYGKPARSGKCNGAVKWLEVYSYPSNRYLTVTGNVWSGSSAVVTEQQDALNWLHQRFMDSTGRDSGSAKDQPRSHPVDASLDDADLLNKAHQARNGAIFGALWSGDTSGQGGDHSAADLALLNLLAFWTGNDPARMDRLFRQSGLFRAKWDVVHHSDGQTYGQASIAKAIAGNREAYSGKKKARTSAKVEPTGAAPPAKADRDDVPDWFGGADDPPPPPIPEEPEQRRPSWKAKLMHKQGSTQLLKNHYNAVMVVEHAFPGLVGYNEFRQRIEARIESPWRKEPGPWTDADTGELAFHIAKEYASFTLDALSAAIMTVAHRHKFNPAQERLRGLAEQWDGQPRIDRWLVDYLGAAHDASNEAYLREIGSAWLKGTCARVLIPGCKRDDVLILRGEQGFLKSTAAQCIADAIHPDAFNDSIGNLDNKDAKSAIRGIIIAELGELSVLNKSDIETIKQFVATRTDHFREAYGRLERDFSRTVSFIGTTNHPTFLKDPTGNRRWWPVTIPAPIDILRLTAALPQLLGEAARRVLDGEQWYVNDQTALVQAEAVRAAHFQDDVWTEAALTAAARLLNSADYVTVAGVLTEMGVRVEQQTVASQTRIGGILRVAGWKDKKTRIGHWKDNKTVWAWFPPTVPPVPPVPPTVPPTSTRQTAAVPPVTPCSPYFEDLTEMEEHREVVTGKAKKSVYVPAPAIHPFYENRGQQGEQGEQSDKQRVNPVPPPCSPSKQGERWEPTDDLSSHHPARPAPVDNSLSADAAELATVLKLYRGWATPDELAKKSGLGSQERVLVAAQELAGKGLALVERGMVKPTAALMEAHP